MRFASHQRESFRELHRSPLLQVRDRESSIRHLIPIGPLRRSVITGHIRGTVPAPQCHPSARCLLYTWAAPSYGARRAHSTHHRYACGRSPPRSPPRLTSPPNPELTNHPLNAADPWKRPARPVTPPPPLTSPWSLSHRRPPRARALPLLAGACRGAGRHRYAPQHTYTRTHTHLPTIESGGQSGSLPP